MIQVRNWDKFQHYKQPKPAWVKLYRDLLGDYEFMFQLNECDRFLVVGLWLLAAQTDNKIRADVDYLTTMLHLDKPLDPARLERLAGLGFITLETDSRASLEEVYSNSRESLEHGSRDSLDKCLDSEEKRREETEKRREDPLVVAAAPTGDEEEVEQHDPVLDVFNAWNAMAGDCDAKRAVELNKERRKHIRERLKSSAWRDGYQEALEAIPHNPFYMGTNDRGWTANLDWFLRPQTVTKILEGQHERKTTGYLGNVAETLGFDD